MIDKTQDVPTGTVKVRRHPPGPRDGGRRWFLVEIGRGRYVKRLNISDEEAEQIISQLSTLLGRT